MNYIDDLQHEAVLFAVDHRTGEVSVKLDPAGMLCGRSFKSVRTPALFEWDTGYHVLELPLEWAHLLSEYQEQKVKLEVLLQFAQHKVSYRTEHAIEPTRYRAQHEEQVPRFFLSQWHGTKH